MMRRTAKQTSMMELVRGEMVLAAKPVPSEQPLFLRPAADSACLIDGVVHEHRITMMRKSAGLPAWMTGVNWHLHPMRDGTWLIVNQNEMQHCLTAAAGRLELRPVLNLNTQSPSRWLIYRQPGRDAFSLRTYEGKWLCWRDGEIVLGSRTGADDETALWLLQRPDPAEEPVETLATTSKSSLRRVLRALKMRLKATVKHA